MITHIFMKPINTLSAGIHRLSSGYSTLPRTRIAEFDNLSYDYAPSRHREDREFQKICACSRPCRNHCTNGVLSIWDLDNLKYTNDTYGHEIGDKYICTLSDLLKKELPKNSVSARLEKSCQNIIIPVMDNFFLR